MSNPHPATPSFGGAYTGYNFADAGSQHGGLQTLPRGDLPPHQNGGGYSVPTPTYPTPGVNHQNFLANATTSSATHSTPPHLPPPPFQVPADFFKQFANSNLPPPPYPPVPIPHLGFSQFPPPQPNFAATFAPPNTFLTNSSHTQQYHPPLSPSTQPFPNYQQNTYVVSKEEGELSDGELDTNSTERIVEPSQSLRKDQTFLSMMPGNVDSPQEETSLAAQPVTFIAQSTPNNIKSIIEETPNASRPVFPGADMGNVFQRQTEVEEDKVPSADSDSISSYNPPSASTRDPEEPDVRLTDPLLNTLDGAESYNPAATNQNGSVTSLLREEAKDALRSLVRHNIRYKELVGEGVDPYILERLYEDLGEPVIEKPSLTPVVVEQKIAAAKSIALKYSQTSKEPAGGSPRNTSQGPEQAFNTTEHNSSSIPVSSASQVQAILRVSDSPKPSPAALVNIEKASGSQPSSTVAMERKDRIAQLLAAKTGRTVAGRPAVEKQPDLPAENSRSPSLLDATPKPLSLPDKPPLPSSEPLIKPKNKAQTELIRQKMEALKREALAKSQAQGTQKAVSLPSSPASSTPQHAAYPPKPGSNDLAADIRSDGPQSHIPGLFMTTAPHPDDLQSLNEASEPAISEKVDGPISMQSTATSVSQDTSAELETNYVQSPSGHTIPVRLSQKRPLASDSFDESGPSLKRPFGRKESYDKVEIVLSATESEGEVEDVEMELDEESDEEKQTHPSDIVPATSVRHNNIRNLPPLTDIPSPNPARHATSVINTPTPTAVQTPGRDRGKEELWKAKNQEIELMRKKIAEMEERRKAKQNATNANSLKTGGKPAVPVIRTSLARPVQPSSPGHARPPVAADPEAPRDAIQSPVLTASRPDELPSTPSTPLYAIKEPIRVEDLRQQLLKRKAAREGTPNAAEIGLRQAQLAEKRAKLAELKREAERREAEILAESKLLEAQLHAELNGEDVYEESQPNVDSDMEGGSNSGDQAALDTLLRKHKDAQNSVVGGTPPANADRALSQEQLPVEAASRPSSPDFDIGSRPSTEDDADKKLASTGRTMTSLRGNTDALKEVQEDPLGRPMDDAIEMMTVPQQSESPAMRVSETDQTNLESPMPLYEDRNGDHARMDNVESNIIDEDGSISMSDSASEDYEPAEPDHIDDDKPDNDSEFYEPADVAEPIDVAELQVSRPDEVVKPVELDQPVARGPTQSTSPITEQPDNSILVDDAEEGMQLTEPDNINKPQIMSQSQEGESKSKISTSSSHFTPYETPRKYFRNFRYHDHFPEVVSSGYKSMTFSNNIDPRKPFCPTELAGETCQDAACEEQHFRQVALTDDKILAQMSTANNLKTKAEHERWVAGLRQVIADLRSKGVKDFHLVASALAAYRRRFSEELSTPTSASSQS